MALTYREHKKALCLRMQLILFKAQPISNHVSSLARMLFMLNNALLT